MGVWLYLLYILFPVPLISLLMLSFPVTILPKSWQLKSRYYFLKIVDGIIFFEVKGNITVHQILTGISFFLFCWSFSEVYRKQIPTNKAISVELSHSLKCSRWREERYESNVIFYYVVFK